ncbi:MAG TPA: CU044_2847 family protein [Mycobacteriales bacterium]|nr:CU044_2847 family protein [Mycobacteriales bacterium]
MTDLAQFPLKGGGSVVVEVAEQPGVARISRGDRSLQRATETFEEALTDIREAAGTVLDQFRSMTHRPDSVEVTFGLSMDAQVGAVLVRGGLEATFQVTLRWDASESA